MSFDATVAPTGSLTLTVTKRVRRASMRWRVQNFIENKYRNLPALLLVWRDARITDDGVIVIKAQSFNSQPKNRADALARLADIIRAAMVVAKKRRPTKPTQGSHARRMDSKTKRGNAKALRGKVSDD